MKKLTCLLLALTLLLGLAACGEEPAEVTEEPTAGSVEPEESAPPAEESVAPAEESVAPAEESEAPAEEEPSPLEAAKEFEGAPLEDLIAAIGEPLSSDYAPSCLGEGEDGNLYYDGFTVYTYRDVDGSETVNYVE